VERYGEEEDVYWHTSIYDRLRLDGCKHGPTFLKYDPLNPENGDVEFK